MAINVQIRDGLAIVAMSDRFDFQVHRKFKEAYVPILADSAIHEIEIEMGRLVYMDSSALGMLMLLRERALAVNKSVRISNPSKVVMQILEIANFSKLFKIN